MFMLSTNVRIILLKHTTCHATLKVKHLMILTVFFACVLYTYIHSYITTHVQRCIYMHAHTCMGHTYIRARIYTYTYIHTYAYVYMCVRYMHEYLPCCFPQCAQSVPPASFFPAKRPDHRPSLHPEHASASLCVCTHCECL